MNKVLCFINPKAVFKNGGYIGDVKVYGSEAGGHRGIRIEIPMGSHSMDAIKEVADWLAGKSWKAIP